MANGSDRVRFIVGGKTFETTTTTLAKAGRHTMLGALLDDSWNFRQPAAGGGEYFIDRNPACFAVLLDLLRTGELHVPPDVPERLLYREAHFYGLLDHVRAARWGPFDGNLLRPASSVTGRAPGDGTAIRAGPDGGCCVAHGRMVHVYDWMLEEQRPISLDYTLVNDVGYLDTQSIVVTARKRGGMRLFRSSTGELQHRFRVAHAHQIKSFAAGALSFSSSDHKIFTSCKGTCNERGIGVWDQNTGQQVDFFYEPPGCLLGDADKLQWLDGSNRLMVAALFPRTDNCFIGLLDFRDKSVAWSWSDSRITTSKGVHHAIAMEDGRSICVVNKFEELGFMDLRSNAREVRWKRRSRLVNSKVPAEESCYPKLAACGGQLFSSMNDTISVFCGPPWVLTSTLRRSYGGSICDFSIGGDRLFALHSDENVFDVWAPPPPSPVVEPSTVTSFA